MRKIQVYLKPRLRSQIRALKSTTLPGHLSSSVTVLVLLLLFFLRCLLLVVMEHNRQLLMSFSECIHKLNEEQSQLLKSLFKTNVTLRKELRREDCEKVINKYEILSRLSWQKIKNTIHNWITCEKRKTKYLL